MFSEGVRHVLVNGLVALVDGKPSGQRAGHALKRTPNMPSRPMRTQKSRSVSVKAKNFLVDVTQPADGRARGTFRFIDPKTQTEVRMVEGGLLQTHGKWASFAARGHVMPAAEEMTIVVIVDGGNPMSDRATISVQLEGGRRLETKLDPVQYRIDSQ